MSTPSKTVMVVDDSDTVRRMLDWVLRPLGVEVLHACEGRDALKRLSTQPVDLAIVDLNMPGMDGIELIRQIRKGPQRSDVPILMLTTEARECDIKMAYDAGANMYLCKPATPPVIRYKVLSLLGMEDPNGGSPEGAR